MTPTPLIRTRVLALAGTADPAVVARLAASDGIGAVRILPDQRHLEVGYDLRRVKLPDLTARLAAEGMPLATGLFSRLGRAIAAFKDDNRRDQADVVHQCCNLPPKDE
jgi:hypothetical protein